MSTYFIQVSVGEFCGWIPSCKERILKKGDINLHLGAMVLQKRVEQSIIIFRCRYLTNPSTYIITKIQPVFYGSSLTLSQFSGTWKGNTYSNSAVLWVSIPAFCFLAGEQMPFPARSCFILQKRETLNALQSAKGNKTMLSKIRNEEGSLISHLCSKHCVSPLCKIQK